MLSFFSRKHWVISSLKSFWMPLHSYLIENELTDYYKEYLKATVPGREGFEILNNPDFSSFYETHKDFSKSTEMMSYLYNEVYLCKLMKDCIFPIVDHYKYHLARQEKTLVTKDKYGDWDFSNWFKEIESFYENKVKYSVITWLDDDKEYKLPGYNYLKSSLIDNHAFPFRYFHDGVEESIISLTHSIIEKCINELPESDSTVIANYSNEMSGHEYEHFVSEIISELGYEAHVTQGSGDQGVDVIAEVNNYKIAIQCKHYNSKVSNKAIQEIHAAKGIYDCDFALVVSNNDYTKSAREAAAKLDVNLLHHEDIPAFIEWVEENYPA